MIAAHQPTIFPDDVLVRVSSVADGTMLDRLKADGATHDLDNRRAFCRDIGIDYQNVVAQMIRYDDGLTYDVLREVGRADTTADIPGVLADGLMTTAPGIGLMLPVADCAATVIFDSRQHRLYLLHLGRHSTLSPLLENTVSSILASGTSPAEMYVWMGPHASKDSYVMEYFDSANDPRWQEFYTRTDEGFYLDMAGFNTQVCLDLGVPAANIEVSPVDTVTSPEYFSHSGGNRTERFAVVAMMRP